MKVRNVKGTAGRACSHGSWLNHWLALAGERQAMCSVAGCAEVATDGAHVRLVGSLDQAEYILPMCRECNESPGELPVKVVKFVAANALTTGCGCAAERGLAATRPEP